jgi:hypothetical protein
VGPSFNGDPILESNRSGDPSGCVWSKSHFRPIVQPQTIGFPIWIFREFSNDPTLGGGFLGSPALFALTAARTFAPGRSIVGRSFISRRLLGNGKIRGYRNRGHNSQGNRQSSHQVLHFELAP